MIIFAVMDTTMPDNPSGLNAQQLQIIIYFVLFVFSSLIGIIVWLAKKLDKKIEEISKYQLSSGRDIEIMKNEMIFVRESLKEIPNIKIQLSTQSQLLNRSIQDFGEMKEAVSLHEKAIQEMRLIMARYLKVNFLNEREKE